MKIDINKSFLGGNKRNSVIATIVIDSIDQAVPLAETLYACGIQSVEVTLRTACAVKAIQKIANEFPEIIVGAGTVLSPEQLYEVKEAGAKYAVAPGLNPIVVETASEIKIPFAPGVCTPSEVEKAIAMGCKILKFFPAEAAGGLKYLKCMASPYLHLGIGFIPLGGIDENNFIEYFREECVVAIGGSWLAPRKMINAQNWSYIRNRCLDAKMKLSQLKNIYQNVIVGVPSSPEREKNENRYSIR